jgi:hypothetical protein
MFNDLDVESYMKSVWGQSEIYKRFVASPQGPMKTDIFRYCIIYDLGGYYFDIKSGFLDDLSSFEKDGALLFWEGNPFVHDGEVCAASLEACGSYLIAQWGLGFAAKHSFLKFVIKTLCDRPIREFSGVKSKVDILNLTGPAAFTKSAHKFVCSGGSLTLNKIPEALAQYEMSGTQCRFIQKTSYTKVFSKK